MSNYNYNTSDFKYRVWLKPKEKKMKKENPFLIEKETFYFVAFSFQLFMYCIRFMENYILDKKESIRLKPVSAFGWDQFH